LQSRGETAEGRAFKQQRM